MKARMLDSNIDNIQQNTGGFLTRKSKIRHSSTEVFTLLNFLNPFIESLLVLKSPNQKENSISLESNQTDLKFFDEGQKNTFESKLKINVESEGQILHSFHIMNQIGQMKKVSAAANESSVETDSIYDSKANKSIDITNGSSRDTNRESSKVGLVANNQGEKVRQSKHSSVNSKNFILNELVSRAYIPYQKTNIKRTDKVFPILNNNLSSYDKHTQSLLTATMILKQADSDTTTFFYPKGSENVSIGFYPNGFNPIILNKTEKLGVSELMPKRSQGLEMVGNLPNSVRQNSSIQLISIFKTIDLVEKQNILNQKNILNNQGLQNFEDTNLDREKFKINNISNEEYKFEQRDKSEQKAVEKSTNYNGNFSKVSDVEQNKVLSLHQSNRQVIIENEPTKEIIKPRENIILARISELPSKISSIVETVTQFPAKAEILLNPKTLGIVIVDITVVNNEVKVMFKTETKEAKQMIEGQIGLLKEKLASLGFEKQNFDFVYQSEDKPFSGFGSNRNESRTEEEILRRQFVRSFAIFNQKNETNFESIWRENDFQHQSSERK